MLVTGIGCNAAAEVIHTEPSQFSPIVVYESGRERCMKFGSMQALGRQTCFEPATPQKMVFDYTRTMMTAMFIRPEIRRVLIIGLGGGTLPMAIQKVAPEARIDTVEIDPAVLDVARRFFGFAPGPRHEVHIDDGRAFVQRAKADGRQYDLVMLDAFDTTYIPPHLMTREFLEEVKSLLTPGGILAANTFSSSELYERESATYATVFGDYFNLRGGNRIIFAVNGELPDEDTLRRNAAALQSVLEPFGIDIDYQLTRFTRPGKHERTGKPLTDAELGSPPHTSHTSKGVVEWPTIRLAVHGLRADCMPTQTPALSATGPVIRPPLL